MKQLPIEAQPAAEDLDLLYMREQLFSRQWRPFISSLMTELFSNFEVEEACGFLRQIGGGVAVETPLPKLGNLEELEAGANAALAEMSWGYVQLGLVGAEIEIVHRAHPEFGPAHPARQAWRTGFSAILEGLYTTWLQMQGGRHDMRARAQAEPADPSAVVLRFGL
ncbi:cellulose biosynthesis protein BcsD [Phenylobacterium sp. LjRoot219]|uniref:cellulose biosynthesis protein BcsD n=1 Tax=Phenylobacterium sp. LjRoot219 TaxID=3342283 RepID=UPI003ED062E3